MDGADQAGTSTSGGEARCDALAAAISAALGGAIRDFDARASGVGRSQEELALSLDRLTLELDKLLEDAPVPLIMQQAAKISSVRNRVLSLNMLLKSIQRRIDRIDQIVSAGTTDNMVAGTSVMGGTSGAT
ncbi:SNARE-associated protein-like protein [Rhynchospora pubera]|uniref:Biogenesis of lysosome-related organelles complex 1 subunit 7 n=1 Tax=Rhynchospora pubera TaxID=906938 RepID=A0AAV8DV66_9POAL|nr:SNARE-associated protein-like protein [Rhynchospora pubera]